MLMHNDAHLPDLDTPEHENFPMLNLPTLWVKSRVSFEPGTWDSRTVFGICSAASYPCAPITIHGADATLLIQLNRPSTSVNIEKSNIGPSVGDGLVRCPRSGHTVPWTNPIATPDPSISMSDLLHPACAFPLPLEQRRRSLASLKPLSHARPD